MAPDGTPFSNGCGMMMQDMIEDALNANISWHEECAIGYSTRARIHVVESYDPRAELRDLIWRDIQIPRPFGCMEPARELTAGAVRVRCRAVEAPEQVLPNWPPWELR